jgi:hypothetical protein
MMRGAITVLALVVLTIAARSEGGSPRQGDAGASKTILPEWIYPEAKPAEEGRFETKRNGEPVGTSAEKGQYSTEAPFHKVVRFYVEKSGLEPPNWSILGREFPGDQVNIPASWSRQLGNNKIVSVLHHIRQESACATLLITDFANGESICVTISRELRDDRTFIQVAKHTQN